MIQNIIFDFDRVFIGEDGVDLLTGRALGRRKKEARKNALEKVKHLSRAARTGETPLGDSLRRRFEIAVITKEDLKNAVEDIPGMLNPGLRKCIHILQDSGKNLFVMSHSPLELVLAGARKMKILLENVFANDIRLKGNRITGLDEDHPLFFNSGKTLIAERLELSGRMKGATVIVGNSVSDLALKKSGIAGTFVYFTCGETDEEIRSQADFSVDRLEQLIELFLYEEAQNSGIVRTEKKGKTLPGVILLENIHKFAVTAFQKRGYSVTEKKEAWDETDLLQRANTVNILGIRSKTQITETVLRGLPDLCVLGAFCIGTNQIDLDAAAEAGVPVFNAPYSNTRSVAELVVGEAIMLMRGIFDKSVSAHQGKWIKSASGSMEIRGKTAGIVGYGHIGSQVSVLLENMGMHILFNDIVDKLPLGNAISTASLDELLERSDLVTLHVPDSPRTRGMMGARELRKIKRGGFLINASRGKVVDLEALKTVMEQKHLAGAAIDVFPSEPAHPEEAFHTVLQKVPNVILTPHIGGNTQEAQQNIAEYVSQKMLHFIDTGCTTGSVNFPQIELARVRGTHRILHIHRNVPGVLAKINSLFAQRNINVESQLLQTLGSIGYLIVDVDHEISEQVTDIMKHITETIKVRRII